MKKINERDIIYTEEVEKNINDLVNNNGRILIVTGARQSGKTTLLKEYEKIETLKNNIVFPVDFEKYYLNTLNQKTRQIYIELILCKELLLKIKDTYLINNQEIQKLFFEVDRKIINLCDYINSDPYNGNCKLEYLLKGSLITKIVNEIKKSGVGKVILEIDRFDWIGESSQYYQEELLSYSQIFDKLVITSDDENLYDYKNLSSEISVIKTNNRNNTS